MQLAAASLLGRLQVQALHGPRVTLALQRLLPPGLVAAIQVNPSLQVLCTILSSCMSCTQFVVAANSSCFTGFVTAAHTYSKAACQMRQLDYKTEL